jgi:uncharacterized membrane protein
MPFWLWWNVLSLDAPAVAAAWALFFARASGAAVPAKTIAALALAVWLVYMTDRVLDGWRARDLRRLQARHRFCAEHKGAMLGLSGVGALATLWLIITGVGSPTIHAGLALGAVLGTYMVCIHFWRGRGSDPLSRLLPKEIAVGFLFAAGTSLPVWSARETLRWNELASWLLFAGLCALNCVAIECWESEATTNRRNAGASPWVNWANSRIGYLAATIAVLACVGRELLPINGGAIAAIASAAMLIALLDALRGRLSTAGLRVLVDATLLIPPVVALVTGRL